MVTYSMYSIRGPPDSHQHYSHKVTFFRSCWVFLNRFGKGFSVSFGSGEGTEISQDGVTVRGRLIAWSMEDEGATKKSASSGGERLLIRAQKWPT